MPHRYFAGRRTTAFDILPDDLIVTEHLEGISSGQVNRLDTGVAVTAGHSRGKHSAGHRAFEVQSGGVYEVHAVEFRPVHTTKVVRYQADVGFVELSDEEAKALRQKATGRPMPALRGSEKAVVWGESVRESVLAELAKAGRADLMSQTRRRVFAAWWISRRDNTTDQWIKAFEELDGHGDSNVQS